MRRFYAVVLAFIIFFCTSCGSQAVEKQSDEKTVEYIEQDSIVEPIPSVDCIEEPEPEEEAEEEEEDPRAGWEAAAVSSLTMILSGDWPRTGMIEETQDKRNDPRFAVVDVDGDQIPELLVRYMLFNNTAEEEEVYQYAGGEYAYLETINIGTWSFNGANGTFVSRYIDTQTDDFVFIADEVYSMVHILATFGQGFSQHPAKDSRNIRSGNLATSGQELR